MPIFGSVSVFFLKKKESHGLLVRPQHLAVVAGVNLSFTEGVKHCKTCTSERIGLKYFKLEPFLLLFILLGKPKDSYLYSIFCLQDMV